MYLWMNFAALKTQSPLWLFAKKAITSCLKAGTCVQSPSMLLLALKGINQRVKQSSHPEFSQNAGICLHPSAHGWKCSLEAMQVVRPCPGSHQFPGLPQPWQLPAAPTQERELFQGLCLNYTLANGVCLCGVSVLQRNEPFWSPQRERGSSGATLCRLHTLICFSAPAPGYCCSQWNLIQSMWRLSDGQFCILHLKSFGKIADWLVLAVGRAIS